MTGARALIRTTAKVALLGAWLLGGARSGAAQDFDVLIVNGRVLDGTGSPDFRADVGIVGGRIVAVGRLEGAPARRTIDATGLWVAPGFVDLHSHGTTALTAPEVEGRQARNLLTQGVTTVVGASDGRNAIWPLSDEIAAYLQPPGIALNVVPKVGHNTLRAAVLGQDAGREATAAEVAEMQRVLRGAMEAGAWGLGAGLTNSTATTDELVALARVLAEYDGFYVAHQRSEQRLPESMLPSNTPEWPVPPSVDHGLDAVRETIEIARQTGIRVVGSHIKSVGQDSWGRSRADTALVEEARREGLQVYLDQYPYATYGAGPTRLLPRWAVELRTEATDGDAAPQREQLRRNLADPAVRARIEGDVEYLIWFNGGPERLIVIDHPDAGLKGMTLEAIARERGLSAVELVFDFALNGHPLEDAPQGAWMRSLALTEDDIERYMRQEYTAMASDAGIVDVPGGYDRGPSSHPRYYGAFVRRIAHYVKDRNATTLPFAVRAATSLPARIIGLPDRGLLLEGFHADVVVFDLEALRDRATIPDPKVESVGIEYVLVNGVLAIDGGESTGELPGRVLLRGSRR